MSSVDHIKYSMIKDLDRLIKSFVSRLRVLSSEEVLMWVPDFLALKVSLRRSAGY